MDLTPFLNLFPTMLVAQEEHSSDLCELLQAQPMKLTGMELEYLRQPRFFSLLEAQGQKRLTVAFKPHQKVEGAASFTSSPRFVNGKLVQTAFVGDFRFYPSKEGTRLWRKVYPYLVQNISDLDPLGRPEKVLTAILKNNTLAQKNFAKSDGKYGFRYSPLTEINMINVLAQYKKPKKNPQLQIREALPSDEENIRLFLQKTHQHQLFGYDFSDSPQSEWNHRKTKWPGWKITDFLICEVETQIIAVTLPWSPSSLKRLSVRNCHPLLSYGLQSLRLFGLRPPVKGQPIETVYLTHWTCLDPNQEAELLPHFLTYLIDHKWLKKASMLAVATQLDSLPGFITQKVPVSVFEVVHGEKKPTVSPDVHHKIDFEMAVL